VTTTGEERERERERDRRHVQHFRQFRRLQKKLSHCVSLFGERWMAYLIPGAADTPVAPQEGR